MRPDGVYRTSVLQPFAGYQPQADVQSVAAAFTGGGLGGIGSWWATLKAKWAMSKAAKFMAINGLGGPPGPAFVTAQQIAPQQAAQMQMLARLAPNSGGGPMASAYDAATRRWASYYIAG